MSRSPPPPSENQLDNTLRRPRSESQYTTTTTTTTATTATSTAASSTSSIIHEPTAHILPPLGDHLPNQGLSDQRRNDDRPRAQSQAQPHMPARLMGRTRLGKQHQPQPAQSDTSAPTPVAGALSSSPAEAVYLPLTPLTTSLPPRTTRRTKAHVPSACVNCKHKHLGCDPERPCRRCVASGKEATCKDVTHKKRGRPPLRAEESLMRHFETPLAHPDPSREPRLQMSPPLNRLHPHRRTSSSREIRPMTELRFPRPGDSPMDSGRPPHPPMWAPPPAVSSSPLARPASSQGDLVAGRPFSSGSSHQSTQPPPSPFFFSSPGGRPPQQYSSPAERARPPPLYHGFGPSIIPPPQQPSSLPAPFSPYHHPTPRSPHHPAISEASGNSPVGGPTLRDVSARPHSAESPAEFRLPPIWSTSPTSGPDPTPQRRAGEMVPLPQVLARTSYGQTPPQSRPRELSTPYPQPLQRPFQATSAPQNRPMTARELPPSLHPPASLPPLSVTSQPADTQTARRESESTPMTAAGTPAEETEQGSRPTKRRKMTLGEMVNNE